MALSRTWQAGPFFKHAAAIFPAIDDVAYAQRFELINFIVMRIAHEFIGLMNYAYLTPVILQQSNNGAYGTGGTWTASTNTLVVSGLSSNFAPTDIWKVVTFRNGASVYIGYISAWQSTTTVTLTGNMLPTGNLAALDQVIVVPSVPSDDSVVLAGINMARTGEQVNLDLQSSATGAIEPSQLEGLRFFRTMSVQNRSRIAYATVGDRINMAKGTALPSYGTLILTYPRLPIAVTQDTDFLDILDGSPVRLAQILLQKTLDERFYHRKDIPYADDIKMHVEGIYKEHQMAATSQAIKEKVDLLI